MRVDDLTGKIFGKLRVLGKAGYQRRTTVWACMCDCGTGANVRRDRLVDGLRVSCGCLSGRMPKTFTAVSNPNPSPHRKALHFPKRYAPEAMLDRMIRSVFKIYIRSARQRGHEFSLTQEQLSTIVKKECHYCGGMDRRGLTAVGNVYRFKIRYPGVENLPTDFPLNGIDRKNPLVGYTIENCVPCCKACNIGKQTQGYEQFIARCCAVARRHSGTPLVSVCPEPCTGTS